MKGFVGRLCTGLVGLFLLGFPALAAAQGKVDVGGGYRWLRISTPRETVKLPTGWDADVSFHVNNRVAVLGQVSGQHDTLPIDGKVALNLFNGGVKINAGGTKKATPFARVLVGDMRFNCSAGDCLQNHMNLQIGGGVTVWATPSVGFEGALDYIKTFTEADDPNIVTFSTNIVFRVGKK
jgi:hypothetical protein